MAENGFLLVGSIVLYQILLELILFGHYFKMENSSYYRNVQNDVLHNIYIYVILDKHFHSREDDTFNFLLPFRVDVLGTFKLNLKVEGTGSPSGTVSLTFMVSESPTFTVVRNVSPDVSPLGTATSNEVEDADCVLDELVVDFLFNPILVFSSGSGVSLLFPFLIFTEVLVLSK
jgi:hypothetical protein